MSSSRGQCMEEWGPAAAMLAADVGLGMMNILVKKSLDEGMNCLVLITLRQLVATLFMAPFAYVRERKTRPKLTSRAMVQIFFSALLGASLTQYLFFLGLRYTSATFACAFLNMAPVFTFLIAVPLGHEGLNIRAGPGRAKLAATALCIGGVAVLIFYNGPALVNGAAAVRGASHDNTTIQSAQAIMGALAPSPAASATSSAVTGSGVRWMVGSVALLAGCLCWSAWFLVQARVSKLYPALYSSTTIMFFLSFLQAAALALATQRQGGISIWVVTSKIQIATVLFAGIVGSGGGFLVMSWCVGKRGPVFTAAFSPLIQIIVGFVGVTFMHETLHLGSVLGSVLVIGGLYLLLWGKTKEAAANATKLSPPQPVQNNAVVPTAPEEPASPLDQQV